MKIGIITIHNPPNYGAMLQAYSLSTHLAETGHQVEIIDYDQPDLHEYFRFKWSFPPRFTNWQRLKRCAAFVRDKQVKSAKTYRSPEQFLPDADNYDALITGSDQVWFTGPVQFYDPLYFLDLPQARARKISYAPSAGGTTDFEDFTPKVKAALARFDHISVRDDNTEALIAPLTDKPIARVVDPTFLCDFTQLLNPSSPQPEPYLLLFGNIARKWDALIKSTAKQLGVSRIVTLQYKNENATHRLGAPSPEDWINHFKHAAGIITSYFHGTAFAINFERPFLAIPTPGRVKKVNALLEDVGLQARVVQEADDPATALPKFAQPIDWPAAKELLQQRVNTSKLFLRRALNS